MQNFIEDEITYLRSVEPDKNKETVFLNLISQRTNNNPLNPGERAYFPPNTFLKSRRITGIEIIPTLFNAGNYISLAATSLNPVRLSGYTLTLVSTEGHRILENCPCLVFYNIQNLGKIKRVDISSVDLQSSYVTNYLIATTNPLDVIPFQFSYM